MGRFPGSSWRFEFLSGMFGLSTVIGSPSGFTPVEIRFADYSTNAVIVFRPPTGFMPVDARFDNFADWIVIVTCVSDAGLP